MSATKPIAASVLGSSVIGIVLLLVAVPPARQLTRTWGSPDSETIQYADALLASAIARFLDPGGHDRLEEAREAESRSYAASRSYSHKNDLAHVINDHIRAVHDARNAALAAFGFIFLGSLIGFVLWLADSRSGLWLVTQVLLALAVLPVLAVLWGSFLLGLPLLALLAAAIVTIGRQSRIARRIRAAEELP